MRSEIPQIEVVTAIGDADLEDYVAQLLFTQGWSIIYRAFDGTALNEFMEARSSELRTIIVYTSELPSFTSDSILKFGSTFVSFISLDGIPSSAHEIMQKIRGQLRLPMVHGVNPVGDKESSPVIVTSAKKIIVITGSAGGPGKTLLAVALAKEIASRTEVTLFDVDFRSIDLGDYIPETTFKILSLSASEKPVALPETDSKEVAIVDVGVLPPLQEVVNDRRWDALLYNSIFDSATKLVYVTQTTKQSLMQLNLFMKEIPALTKKIPITYICITVGTSKQLRQGEEAFIKLVGSAKHFLLQEAQIKPNSSNVLDSLLISRGKIQKEIGSIATSLLQ